jgi:murein DD-endopeptidase MepM/ murein hydrolase activator NlpD
MDRVTSINWYGNTEWAFQNRGAYYSQLQGIHSGIDFIVPAGTPITSAINRRGKVISIDNQPYDYKAGPHNILVDYGDFLVLYGHMSPNTPHQVGDPIDPGSIIGNSGTDGTTPHLHMEVIRKHPEWDSLPPEKQTVSRPGNIRTNPVPYLSPEVQKELEQKQWDAFHPTPDGKWQNPSDQPDIDPASRTWCQKHNNKHRQQVRQTAIK